MKRIFFFAAIAAICFVSCNKDEIFTERDNGRATVSSTELLNEVFSADREADMLRPFARALYNAMNESPMLRELIRTRALEKFNREYDVLYQFIKGELVENGLTVRQLLLTHFESEEVLAYIERNRPTLTIFVPQLPEGSFSAETWNTDEEVPFVALHITRHIHTPIIGDFGEYGNEFLVKAEFIPGFPVVALRDNARVRVVEGSQRTRSAALDNPNSDFIFEFVDDFFDRNKIATRSVFVSEPLFLSPDPVLRRAFEIYPTGADGWQRDYVYYGITPGNQNGSFTHNFQEHITSFRFLSVHHTPQQVLNMLTQYGRDPVLSGASGSQAHSWTSGNYRFRIRVQTGSTSGHLTALDRFFLARPNDLFQVTYEEVRLTIGRLFIPRVTGFWAMPLEIPLMNWNLAQFEPTIAISIAKENPSGQTTTSTVSHEAEFAGNVNMDFKFGLRFGSTARYRRTITTQVVTRTYDLELGNVFVNFGDNVILGHSERQRGTLMYRFFGRDNWAIREHHNGMFAITVMPKRVQP